MNPFNWLAQVAAITRFGLMSLPQRRGSVAASLDATQTDQETVLRHAMPS